MVTHEHSASQVGGGFMNFGNPNDDKASILTVDRLRKFNDINGYEHGPAADVPAADDQDAADEQRDQVNDLVATPLKNKGGRKYLNG